MKVYTFAATDPDCPVQAIARIWGPGPKGKPEQMPIIIYGATPADAERKALDWWADRRPRPTSARGRKPLKLRNRNRKRSEKSCDRGVRYGDDGPA